MTATWDPHQYELYKDERSRPFFDLLHRIPDRGYRNIVDLGCGSGELTRSLAERWPQARVLGLDSSPEMLRASASFAVPGRLEFRLGNIADFDVPHDLIFSNAALQWLDGHDRLIPRLAGLVQPRGCLAVQMPANTYARSHALLLELAESAPWAARLPKGWMPGATREPDFYVRALQSLGFRVDAWMTEYYLVLRGEDAVLEWVKGTALRPLLSVLDGEETETFIQTYAEKLRQAYPKGEYGTLFPFKRVFFVATRD